MDINSFNFWIKTKIKDLVLILFDAPLYILKCKWHICCHAQKLKKKRTFIVLVIHKISHILSLFLKDLQLQIWDLAKCLSWAQILGQVTLIKTKKHPSLAKKPPHSTVLISKKNKRYNTDLLLCRLKEWPKNLSKKIENHQDWHLNKAVHLI